MNKMTIRENIHYRIIRPLRLTGYRILNLILSVIPMKDIIIFESNPDFACNSYEIYKYIKKNNLFPKFRMLWLVNSIKKEKNAQNNDAECISLVPRNIKERIHNFILCNRAKIIIDCNRHYPHYKTSPKQLNIYLDHGMPLKWMGNIFKKPIELSCSYIVSQSAFFVEKLKEEYELRDEQIYIGGVPRNDQFFSENIPLDTLFPDYKLYKHIVIWVPTFRQIPSTGRVDCISSQPLGLPILYSKEDIDNLESKLEELNILLIIKPHPVQDLSILKDVNYSNLRILYNEEMLENGIQTNELLKQCDAMITDYSGIYYDYLLTDRPIAITLDDYEEYRKQKGFMYDNPLDILKGYYIYNINDLFCFLQSLNDKVDLYYDERQIIKKMIYDKVDGNSTQRVCEFIVKSYNSIWQI